MLEDTAPAMETGRAYNVAALDRVPKACWALSDTLDNTGTTLIVSTTLKSAWSELVRVMGIARKRIFFKIEDENTK